MDKQTRGWCVKHNEHNNKIYNWPSVNKLSQFLDNNVNEGSEFCSELERERGGRCL